MGGAGWGEVVYYKNLSEIERNENGGWELNSEVDTEEMKHQISASGHSWSSMVNQ